MCATTNSDLVVEYYDKIESNYIPKSVYRNV